MPARVLGTIFLASPRVLWHLRDYGINQLPRNSDYWKDDPFIGNTGIKQTMTRNRFKEISQFLHFADSTRTPACGKNGYD